ncbi:MAG: glycosyltransferase family 2 protein [Chloroflexi bacterium]|nr:glycosyltransferase family 2 protein [Chloroflexota bacterium]
MPDVSIVVVNYNQRDYTAQCIDSILATPPNASYEIDLVDNASSDGSADWLAERYPGVKLIRSKVNGGIAGGNNLGIRAGSGKYVLLLNNDTIVLPGSIDRVVGFLNEHPEAGGVGGQLLNPDGSFQSSYFDFASLGQVFVITTKLGSLLRPFYPSYGPTPDPLEVSWLSTAFMLFRRDALEGVGLVDERFFIYSDEPDLQYRLRKAGWKIYYLPEVKTIHFGGKSLTPWRRRRLVYRGYLLFFAKHRGQVQNLTLRGLFALASLTKLAAWSAAFAAPGWQQRARKELGSNKRIFVMSIRPGIEAP